MQSKATTVEKYLAELPADRRAAISAVRKILLDNLDKDYEEGMQFGMISYYVPYSVYPPGYRCRPKKPLPFACLASQKNYMSLYLMAVYGETALKQFQQAWAKTGKKLDMGKGCVRFKRLEDFASDVVAETIRRMPAKKYIAFYESAFLSASERSKPSADKKTKTKRPARAAKTAKATSKK